MRTEKLESPDGSYSLYHFDDGDRETLVEDFDSDARLTMFIRREYNDAGEVSGWTVHEGDGRLITRLVVRFSPHGKPLEHLEYDADGNLEDVTPADA